MAGEIITRLIQVERGTTPTATLTADSYTSVGAFVDFKMKIEKEMVDITDSEMVFRKLLAGAGTEMLSFTLNFIFNNNATLGLMQADVQSTVHSNYRIVFPNAQGTWTGKFQVISAERDGKYNDAVRGTVNLESDRGWTFT